MKALASDRTSTRGSIKTAAPKPRRSLRGQAEDGIAEAPEPEKPRRVLRCGICREPKAGHNLACLVSPAVSRQRID